MTRTKLLLTAALGVLLLLTIGCGTALNGDSGDGERGDGFQLSAQGGERGSNSEAPSVDDGSLLAFSAESGDALESADYFEGDSEFGQTLPPTDPQLAATLDRKIIQSTSIDLEIEGENGVSRTFQDIIRIAETAGGFVANSSFSNVDDRQFADVTIRVPGNQYQSVLADIRGMGNVTQEGSDANDVSEE